MAAEFEIDAGFLSILPKMHLETYGTVTLKWLFQLVNQSTSTTKLRYVLILFLVELDEEIYPEYDSRLLSDEKFYDKWQPLKAAVSKSREKRALKKLKYPGDCKSSKLQNFAKKCGLTVVPGGSHIKVCDGNRQITVIPHSVKSNYTCNNIINILNGRCI